MSSGPELVEITAAEAALQFFAADVGNLGDALSSDATLSARRVTVADIILDYDEETSRKLDGSSVQVLKNAAGEFSLVVDGERFDFTTLSRRINDDLEKIGYDLNTPEGYTFLFSWRGEIDEILAGESGFAVPLEFFVDPTNAANATTGFSIVGTETSTAGLPTTGTATFDGNTVMYFVPTENLTNFSGSRRSLRGEVSMDVDFANTTISGEIDALRYRVRDGIPRDPIAGLITMEDTVINANGYIGDLTIDADGAAAIGIADTDFGQYSGVFYGPNAEETGGGIVSTLQAGDTALNGYGFFIATQE